MAIKKYFYEDELAKDRVAILINHRNIPITGMKSGTAFKISALLFNLPYPDFLRMARDNYNGTITGKNCLYPMLTFQDKAAAGRLVKELNIRMSFVMERWEKEFNNGTAYIGRSRHTE